MEVVQEPHHCGGAGGVPLGADALYIATHTAPSPPTTLLLHQLLPRDVPRRGPPHRGSGLLPHKRYSAHAGVSGDRLGLGTKGKASAHGQQHKVFGKDMSFESLSTCYSDQIPSTHDTTVPCYGEWSMAMFQGGVHVGCSREPTGVADLLPSPPRWRRTDPPWSLLLLAQSDTDR